MRIIHFLVVTLISLLGTGFVTAQDAQSPLARKLIDGSPWRFTTAYENTVHEFRFGENEKLQRKSPRTNGAWVDETIQANQTIEYRTINGHVITFLLDRDGNATASHSRHPSQFKSVKE